MKNRIIEVRKKNKLSQDAFAKRLGLSRNFIGLVENGERNLSDRTIRDICSEFRISELWLRTGNGDMCADVLPLDENVLIISKYLDDPDGPIGRAILSFLKVYDSYPDNKKSAIADFVEYALNAFEKGEL